MNVLKIRENKYYTDFEIENKKIQLWKENGIITIYIFETKKTTTFFYDCKIKKFYGINTSYYDIYFLYSIQNRIKIFLRKISDLKKKCNKIRKLAQEYEKMEGLKNEEKTKENFKK